MFATIVKACAFVVVKAVLVDHNQYEAVDIISQGGFNPDSSLQEVGKEEVVKKMEKEKMTPRLLARSLLRSSTVDEVKGVVVDHDGHANGVPSVHIIRQGESDEAISASFQQIGATPVQVSSGVLSVIRNVRSLITSAWKYSADLFRFMSKEFSLVPTGTVWRRATADFIQETLSVELEDVIVKILQWDKQDSTKGKLKEVRSLLRKARVVAEAKLRDRSALVQEAGGKVDDMLLEQALEAYSAVLVQLDTADLPRKGRTFSATTDFIDAMKSEALEQRKKIDALLSLVFDPLEVDSSESASRHSKLKKNLEDGKLLYDFLQKVLERKLDFIASQVGLEIFYENERVPSADWSGRVRQDFAKLYKEKVKSITQELSLKIDKFLTKERSEGFRIQINKLDNVLDRAVSLASAMQGSQKVTEYGDPHYGEVFAFLDKFARIRIALLNAEKVEDIQVDSKQGFQISNLEMGLSSLEELSESFFALVRVAEYLRTNGKKLPRSYQLEGYKNRGVVLAKLMDLVDVILTRIDERFSIVPASLSFVLQEWKNGTDTIRATCTGLLLALRESPVQRR